MVKIKKSILLVGNHLSSFNKNLSVGEELASKLTSAGWHPILVSRKWNKALRLMDMLWVIFGKRNKYSLAVVEIFSGSAFLWAYLSSALIKLMRKPLIVTLHGGNLPLYASKHTRIVSRLLHWAEIVTAPSSYLLQNLALYRSDIRLIPNGLEIDRYFFRLRDNPQSKLIWLRAFHKIYNPSLAPPVVKILENQKFAPHLIMIGPDKGDGSLQDMLSTAQALGIANKIEVIQGVPKEQVPEMLNRGDIFINTTNIDNTPVSLIEAMACGCCIVTTNVGGIPYLLVDGIDALLVPPNDPEAMAAAVKRVLTEPGLAHQLSTNARKKANHFDWSVVFPQWEELFNQVIDFV